MPLSSQKLYRVHVLNLRSVQAGIDQVERELRAAISRRDKASTDTLLKTLLLLTGAWAECRLRKLLHEPNGFTGHHRDLIKRERSQLEWWKKALEIGFRTRCSVPNATLPAALPATPRLRYNELLDIIESDLRPIIEMRNTLAHGQWMRPLNNEEDDINSHMIAALSKENALTARFKRTILEKLAAVLHDLVAGNNAFERDYDRHFVHLENARRDLLNRDYATWEASMINKHTSGRVKRNQNLQPRPVT